MLNDPRVRERLAQRGLSIPAETFFVGGMHNTCNETLTFFDLDLLPESHRSEFESVQRILEAACDRNAHERCRRFESAPLTLSFAGARQHVEAGRKTWRRSGPNGATRPTPSASSAGASGRAACSSTAAPSSRRTIRPRTTPRAPS